MGDAEFSCEACDDNLVALREHLHGCGALPLSALSARLKLQLIVEELFTNTMRHGGGGPVQISLRRGDGEVHLQYEDRCPPFNPFADELPIDLEQSLGHRTPGNLGLILIRAFADQATHKALPVGNRIELVLPYSAKADPG